MVSYSIPMGHESLRTILLHTDPNLRFKIAQRIPKIRLTEKTVPLKIESLSLDECTTTVNSQSYKLGIYRHYHTEDIPMGIQSDNNEGGVCCDLDQYGLEIPTSSTPILNGDVSYQRENEVDERDTDEIEQHYQFSLRRFENALAKINQLELEGKRVEDFLAGPMTEDDERIRDTVRYSKELIQDMINRYRADLLPFHYRRNNISPPYTCYIQLTITQEEDVTKIQRYHYNHRLYEAGKNLNEILFGNRPVIIVKQFQCENFEDILRIPVGFKIAANFVYGYSDQIVPISSILDSSRALTDLSINVTEELVLNFQQCCVKNAKLLSLCIHKERIDLIVRAFETIENQGIHIGFFQYDNPSANHYFLLIQGWMSTERCVGSIITFGLKTDQIGEEILELLRNGNEGTESTERCVTVPLGVATILKIFYCGVNIENYPEFLLTARVIEA